VPRTYSAYILSLFLTSSPTPPHNLNTKSVTVSSPGPRLTTFVFSFQMIVRVFADDVGEDEPLVTDVPVTPDTTCRDVIECCRDPGDEHCALVETWGSGHGELVLWLLLEQRPDRRATTDIRQ
jgi:hypothetical protein